MINLYIFLIRENWGRNSKLLLRYLNVLDKELDKMYKICLRNVIFGIYELLYNNVRFGLFISVWYLEIFFIEMWISLVENV